MMMMMMTYSKTNRVPSTMLSGTRMRPPRVGGLVQNTTTSRVVSSRAVQDRVAPPSFESAEWKQFGQSVSGEWDGVSATFDADGQPRQLPEYYVPQAYRDWDVQIHDWQCQCSMLCDAEGMKCVTRKLMPTVGCEADAIAFTEEKGASSWENSVVTEHGLATKSPGDAVSKGDVFDCAAEHILPLPEDGRRIRIVHLLKRMGPERLWRVQGLEMYLEKRDGPYTGRRELAGCGGGMDPFATSEPLSIESLSVFTPETAKARGVRHVNDTRTNFSEEPWGFLDNVDASSFVGLPKNCWSAFSCETLDDRVTLMLQTGVLSSDGTSISMVQQRSVNGILCAAELITIQR
jgi:hypothetical protein